MLQQALILVERLERISADSIWAHRSSGIRGSLLKAVEDWSSREAESKELSDAAICDEVAGLIQVGFNLLEKAAREY